MANGLLGILLLLCAQDPNIPPLQNDVNRALDKAGEALAKKVLSDLPHNTAISSGHLYDALVLYAMHHAGVKPESRAYKKALDDVSTMSVKTTYMASTIAMALAEIDRVKYRMQIWTCGQYLVDNMAKNGQWPYGRVYMSPRPPDFEKYKKSGVMKKFLIKRFNPFSVDYGDNSNAQYAALGLYACYRSGFTFERRTIDTAIAWWETTQRSDGSWDYGAKGGKVKTQGFGSMTAGGGSSIIMLRRIKGQRGKISRVRSTLGWCSRYWRADANPQAPDEIRQSFGYYWLYAAERLGDLFPQEKWGRVKWYAQGANWLVQNQDDDGFWREGSHSGMEIADTCFAILFLQRVMMVRSVSASGKKQGK